MKFPDLTDKTIAVVGNAVSILTHKFGEEIDNHDFIIRINRAMNFYETSEKYDKHVGTRTDMWCVWQMDEYEVCGLKADYMMQMAFWYGSKFGDQILYYDEESIIKLIEISNNEIPSTGMMVLDWLTRQSVKSVDVYGFDWKDTPTWTDLSRYIDVHVNHNFNSEKQFCIDHFKTIHGFNFKGVNL